jgi:two-component system, OmpR family, response regulator
VRILVAEDDPEMGRLLTQWLAAQGFESHLARNGLDGLIAFNNEEFAAAAIDVMLPGMTGFELCRHIREAGSNLPIILLTARDAVDDRVQGLDAGADDYLIKPFDFAELGARLRALLRRDAAGHRTSLRVGNLELDSMTAQAAVSGRRVTMSIKEFTLLRLLAGSPGVTVSRTTILEEVWGTSDFIHPNIVEQYISFLRKKLEAEESGVQIRTVRGRGYFLEETG